MTPWQPLQQVPRIRHDRSRRGAHPGRSSCHWSKAANAGGLGAEPPRNTEVPKNRMSPKKACDRHTCAASVEIDGRPGIDCVTLFLQRVYGVWATPGRFVWRGRDSGVWSDSRRTAKFLVFLGIFLTHWLLLDRITVCGGSRMRSCHTESVLRSMGVSRLYASGRCSGGLHPRTLGRRRGVEEKKKRSARAIAAVGGAGGERSRGRGQSP